MIKQLLIEEYQGSWKRAFREWVAIPFVGSLIIALTFDWNDLLRGDYKDYFESVGISFAFWSLLSNGNSILICYQDKRWTWLDQPLKRLLIGTVVMLVYSVVTSCVILYLYIELYFKADFISVIESNGLWSQLKLPLMITSFFMLTGHGRAFLMEWRQAAIDVERLKTENLKSKFESLKSQVNPHFLFNSLNALSSLVHTDQDRATDFIQKLSEVYRYVLDHQNDEVVTLQEEVSFLKSYVYLNEIRFGSNLKVTYENLENNTENWMIPPVVLQLLMENALKHNEVSTDFPLNVTVRMENDSILISNNLNPLNNAKMDASGIGMSNIIERFSMLTSQKVVVNKSETDFSVLVPLLTIEA